MTSSPATSSGERPRTAIDNERRQRRIDDTARSTAVSGVVGSRVRDLAVENRCGGSIERRGSRTPRSSADLRSRRGRSATSAGSTPQKTIDAKPLDAAPSTRRAMRSASARCDVAGHVATSASRRTRTPTERGAARARSPTTRRGQERLQSIAIARTRGHTQRTIGSSQIAEKRGRAIASGTARSTR